MRVEKKKINGKIYLYLKKSIRENGKVKNKTMAYLGKYPMSKKDIEKKKKELEIEFLSTEQLDNLENIRKIFSKKLKSGKKLVDDMFRDFKTYYIYNTNSIEGNTMTLEETNLLLNDNITPEGKDLREVYDHINAKEVFDWLLKEKPEINKDIILKIQKELLKNIDNRRGFRDKNVRVFGATFDTSDAKYVNTDMNLLLRWYRTNKGLHPLTLASIFHEKFERIHPFFDGNGRTGRMLMNLILLKKNFPPLIIRNKDRKSYYKVLDEGHKAELNSIDECYKGLVQFCYDQLIKTYKDIFEKWG